MEQAQFNKDWKLHEKLLGCIPTARRRNIIIMTFNQAETYLKTLRGEILKQVGDFKYLGSWIADSKKDMEVRQGRP